MSISLKDLPKEDLPRERLERLGVENLSNAELLSILIGTGTKSISVRELSDSILSKFSDIRDLKNANIRSLTSIKGMGLAKSTNVLAALELGKRVYEEDKITTKLKITSPIDAYRYFGKIISSEEQENFLVIFLDNKRQYLGHKIMFKGTINQSIVHPREVFREALKLSCNGIIVMHNHPSGDATPSKSDDEVTREMANAGLIMGINLLDHIVVGKSNYFSYIEEGQLRYEE